MLLSGRGEAAAQDAEAAVRAAGVTTVVRAAGSSRTSARASCSTPSSTARSPCRSAAIGEPFVDADDIADVAVAALTEEGHAGALYEVTGPRLLSFAEAVAEIARATGRDLAYVPVPMAAYAQEAAAQGIPADVCPAVAYLFCEVLDGRNARLTDGVQRALGGRPRDFAEYVADTAAAGVWHA